MKQVRWSSWGRSRHGVCMKEWTSIFQLTGPSKNEGVEQSYLVQFCFSLLTVTSGRLTNSLVA
jgi:hypothetical protein